jgi:hypothetical protein
MIGLLDRIRRGRADAALAVEVGDFYRRGIAPDRLRPTAARSAAYAAQCILTDRVTAYRAHASAGLRSYLDTYGIDPEQVRVVRASYQAADERYAMRCRAEARAEIEAAQQQRARPLTAGPLMIEGVVS